MNGELQIQNKKLELIQWLSTIEDWDVLEKISDLISRETKRDWWDHIPLLKKRQLRMELQTRMQAGSILIQKHGNYMQSGYKVLSFFSNRRSPGEREI